MFTLADLGAQHRQATLSNGTRVVVFERPGMPVYLRASFLAGSRFDSDGKDGTSHFLEHMLVAGTKKFPSKDKLAAYIEQYGGVFGATTRSDSMNINVGIGDPADTGTAFEVLHEMLFESLFDDTTLETERGSVLGEIRDRLSNPGVTAWDLMERLIFQGTPLAKSTAGTAQSIGEIRKEDVTTFFHKNMTADRMVLVAAGGVTIEEVVAQAERLLLLPVSQAPTFERLPVLRERTIAVERYPGKEQVHAVLGFRTVPAHHPDGFVLDIIAEVLGGGRASELQKELRYKRGLVYGVGAWQIDYADAGLWMVRTSAAKGKLQEVFDITTGVIARVVAEGCTQEQVRFAQDKIMKSQRMELQTSSSWVDFHASRQLLSANPWTLVDYLQGISAVTPEDTKAVAQKYFGPGKEYVTLCGDVAEDAIKLG